MPDNSMIDKHFNVLNTDTSVRFFPQNDLGDLQYPVGKLPAQVATTIEAHGDPGDWPFDSYKTDTIQADVLVGTGENRQYKPGRVEVTGSLEGWDIADNPGCAQQRRPRSPGQRHHHPASGQGAAGLRPGDLSGPHHPADAGAVRGHSDADRSETIPAAVFHLVCRDAVRRGAVAKYPPRKPSGGFVDRPSRRDLGTGRAGRSAGPVHRRVVPALQLGQRCGPASVSPAGIWL